MKNKLTLMLALLIAALPFSFISAQSIVVFENENNHHVFFEVPKAQQSVNLIVFEIDAEHKTIVCGDGITPQYWRFRIPDSKWSAVFSQFKLDIPAEIGYFGYDLYDSRSLFSEESPLVTSLVFFKPIKVF